MKAMIVYESFYGNTRAVAEAIRNALATKMETHMVNIITMPPDFSERPELIVVGSATRGFRPCPATIEWLKSLSPFDLEGTMVAAFDTRIALPSIKNGVVRWLVKTGGFAAADIQRGLVRSGGAVVAKATGFDVADKEGPLLDGELERAYNWGLTIAVKAKERVVLH